MKKFAKTLISLLLVAAMAIPAALIASAATTDTTVPSGLTVPATPFGAATVKYRIGMDDAADFVIGGASAASGVVAEDKAIYGKAVTFKCSSPTVRGEVQLNFPAAIDVTGVTGVMFYVDFTNTTHDTAKSIMATVTFNVNDVRSQAGGARGWYQDGSKWVETVPAAGGGDRMALPASYKGWVYIPAWSYKASTDIMNYANYSFKNLNATSMRLYTDGYVFDDGISSITFDEILLLTSDNGYKTYGKNAVDSTTVPSCAPAKLPNGSKYKASTRIGFDSTDNSIYSYADAGNMESQGYVDDINGKGMGITYSQTNGQTELRFAKGIDPAGAEGVLFHVDFSKATINGAATQFGASVTFNVNDYRSNIAGAKGYYMADGATEWTETAPFSGSACRMGVPTNFKGWIYVPADSYQNTNFKTAVAADGKFINIPVNSLRLYTTGALGSFSFDEIMFVSSVKDEPKPETGDATLYVAAVSMIALFGMGITVAIKRRHA